MKRKLPLLFSVLGCAALGLAAGEADAQAKFNLRWGHYLADSPFVQLEKDFTQEIEKRTNGQVKITITFAQGLGKIVVRELVGVYEFVTAPFPVPAGFQPIIEPEFPWGYFDSSAPKR